MTCLGNHRQSLHHRCSARRKVARRASTSPKPLTAAGWILGPIVGAQFVFSGGEGANANAGLHIPYLGIGIFVSILLVVFIFSKVPDLHAPDESRKSAEQKTSLKPFLRTATWPLASRCWWFAGCCISSFPRFWDWSGRCSTLIPALLQPTKYGLLIVCLRRFVHSGFQKLGHVPAQTFYAGHRRAISLRRGPDGHFQLLCQLRFGKRSRRDEAARPPIGWAPSALACSAVGRLCGSAVISQLKPHLVLAAYAVINVVADAPW